MVIRSLVLLCTAVVTLMSGTDIDVKPKPNHTTLAGFVIEDGSRQPIQWASVQILGGTQGDATLENGSFMIRGVNPGEHKLVIAMLKYKSETIVVQAIQDSVILVVVPLQREHP
jgi:hypothetical protein